MNEADVSPYAGTSLDVVREQTESATVVQTAPRTIRDQTLGFSSFMAMASAHRTALDRSRTRIVVQESDLGILREAVARDRNILSDFIIRTSGSIREEVMQLMAQEGGPLVYQIGAHAQMNVYRRNAKDRWVGNYGDQPWPPAGNPNTLKREVGVTEQLTHIFNGLQSCTINDHVRLHVHDIDGMSQTDIDLLAKIMVMSSLRKQRISLHAKSGNEQKLATLGQEVIARAKTFSSTKLNTTMKCPANIGQTHIDSTTTQSKQAMVGPPASTKSAHNDDRREEVVKPIGGKNDPVLGRAAAAWKAASIGPVIEQKTSEPKKKGLRNLWGWWN